MKCNYNKSLAHQLLNSTNMIYDQHEFNQERIEAQSQFEESKGNHLSRPNRAVTLGAIDEISAIAETSDVNYSKSHFQTETRGQYASPVKYTVSNEGECK